MKEKVIKANGKKSASVSSVRIRATAKERAKALLLLANKKKAGRKVKFDELIDLALGLVTDEHIKTLQDQSLSNEDRKEQLRQRYIELRGPIGRDEFTGFMMTADFQAFMSEQQGRGIVVAASA